MPKNDVVRERLLALIGERFGSDAELERAASLPPKTVSNWRRGRSTSYMRMLPMLAELLGVRTFDLLPSVQDDEGEARLVHLWREAASLPSEEREALLDTLSAVIRLYLGKTGKK